MNTENNNIESFISSIKWSESKEIEKNGEIFELKVCSNLNSEFWNIWKFHKNELKSKGISCGKDLKGNWQITNWQEKGQIVEIKKQAVKAVILSGETCFKLLPYQIEHVKNLIVSIEDNGSALDGSDTGTGKTYSALAVCKELNLMPVIVCPKSVKQSWLNALKHFNITKFYVNNYEQYKNGNTEFCKSIEDKKGNFDHYKFNINENQILIYDECHRAKNYKTKNAKMLVDAKSQKIKILALSATVADNPLQLYALGYVLGLFNSVGSFWGWATKHGVHKNDYGFEFDGRKENLEKIHNEIYPRRGDRLSIANLGSAFPETLILPDVYDLNGNSEKIQKIYDEMEKQLSNLSKKAIKDSENHLTIMLRARQKVELLKVPTFIEMAQDALEENMSVAIFVSFEETIQAIADKLNTNCIINGKNSEEEREQRRVDFQLDRERVIICNIKAGGVGISLHDITGKHQRLSIISPTWSAQDLLQALGRVHRAEGKTKSIQKIVYAAGTVEESICDTVKNKIQNIHLLNDGDLSKGLNF